MSTPQMFCPACRTELRYETTLQMGVFEPAGYREAEVLDVGSCPTCGRRWYRDRATATFRPEGWEPRCPDCGTASTYAGVAVPGEPPQGVVFACPIHPTRRWLWQGDDAWSAMADRRNPVVHHER